MADDVGPNVSPTNSFGSLSDADVKSIVAYSSYSSIRRKIVYLLPERMAAVYVKRAERVDYLGC